MKRRQVIAALGLALPMFALLGLRCRYGGGEPFNYEPSPASGGVHLETIAQLETPPGNIAIGPQGTVFFTFHPDAHPPYPLAELMEGQPRSLRVHGQAVDWVAPLAMRVDAAGRLWILDTGLHALNLPTLRALDLETREWVHEHEFTRDEAPLGAHFNDFRFDASGRHLVIADASIMAKSPALVVYDTHTQTARRVLESHESLQPGDFIMHVDGEPVTRLGVFSLRPGVDSIAYDAAADELVFAAMTSPHLYRLSMSALTDERLDEADLAAQIERGARKPVTDGMVADAQGRVYAGDIEHDGLVRFVDGEVETLVMDPRIRWIDGMDLGPDGALYLSCSALNEVLLRSASAVREGGPYPILKVQLERTD